MAMDNHGQRHVAGFCTVCGRSVMLRENNELSKTQLVQPHPEPFSACLLSFIDVQVVVYLLLHPPF